MFVLNKVPEKLIQVGLIASLLSSSGFFAVVEAQQVYHARVSHTHHYHHHPTISDRFHTTLYRHPIATRAGIGGAAGVGIGAIAGHSLLRGGLAGAAAGTGVGLIDKNRTLRHEPLARRTLKGGVIGAGVGIAAGAALLPAAAIGAGVGVAVHYAKKYHHTD